METTVRTELEQLLRELFSDQLLAVLATQSDNGPYGSLVAFYAVDDLKRLLFATARGTRKYANLTGHPQVAMVIDTRSNREGDFRDAMAVTAVGRVAEAFGSQKEEYEPLFLARHPSLVDFVHSPGSALIIIEVQSYYIVRQFQQVTELRISR
jgi:heme iron utilization protein